MGLRRYRSSSEGARSEIVSVHPFRVPSLRRGFTLLELILVLVLISITAGVSISAYFERSEITLENACVLLAKEMRSAQNRAAYLQQPILFSFDTDSDQYHVARAGRGTGDDVYVRAYGRDAVFRGVDIVDSTFDDGVLLFDKSGFAVHGGDITLSFGDDVRVLRVESPTGRIEILNSSSDWTDAGF